MDIKPNIIALARHSFRTENLLFLLRLSNYQVTHVQDDIEAFNYLVQRQQSPQPVDLLLIDGAEPQQQFLQLLSQLECSKAMLPILLVHQGQSISLGQLGGTDQYQEFISQCSMNAVNSCLRKILGNSEQTQSRSL